MNNQYKDMSEDDLKALLSNRLGNDFNIEYEVRGRHLIDGNTVFADMLIKPKSHLAGFDNLPIVIEVKALDGNSGRLGQVVHQAATYVQSEYYGIRPMFGLIFPSFQDFAESHNHHLDDVINEQMQRLVARTTEHLAQFMNVGHVEWPKLGGWNIKLGGQRYYSTADGKGATNLLKRYIGTKK